MLHIFSNFLLRTAITVVAAGLFLVSCENDNTDDAVVLASTPASIELGTQQVVELRSLEPVFNDSTVTPAISTSGLLVKSIAVIDETRALATVITDANTEIGLHRFEFDFGKSTASWEISVIAVPVGPGTATIDRDVATAGARMAEFKILGEETHFDSEVIVDVEGAPGMQILGTNIISGSTLEVFFSIDVTQPPTSATIVLMDGAFKYEFPFQITAPAAYHNVFENQVLTRGQVGTVKFGGMGPTLYEGSRPGALPVGVEIGVTYDASHGVSMAMRVPDNFEGTELTFDMQTWLNGGATMETLSTTVQIVDRAFIVPSPSVILSGAGEASLTMKTRGISFSDVTDFVLDGSDLFVMTRWSAANASAAVITSAGTLADNYTVEAFIGARVIDTQLTIVESHDSPACYASQSDVHEGDRLYVPVSVATNDLIVSDFTVSSTENIAVLESTVVDSGTVVLDIKVADDVPAGNYGALQRLDFTSNGQSHGVYLNIVESGVAAP